MLTKAQHYGPEILDAYLNGTIEEFLYQHINPKLDTNTSILCAPNEVKKWGGEQYIPMIEVSQLAYNFFSSLKEYWIVKDPGGNYYIYKFIPYKNDYSWEYQFESIAASEVEGFLGFNFNSFNILINWEDEEPTRISDILNRCQIVENTPTKEG